MEIKKLLLLLIVSFNLITANNYSSNVSFRIEVDPKIELGTIFLHYSYWDYFGKFRTQNFDYYNKMKNHFDQFANHESILWFNDASKNWNLDDPLTAILWFEGIPLKQKLPFPLHPTSRIDTTTVKIFADKLNKFAEDSDFMKFWSDNEELYKQMIENVKSTVPYEKHLNIMEEFFGSCKEEFIFILAPLINGASFGPQIKDEGKVKAHFISGYDDIKNGIPRFKSSYLNMLIFHEFGHSFVNPICEEYREELFKYEYLSEYIKSDFLSNYNGWFPICHEHIVRASESILLKMAGFEKEAKENYKKNLRLGFTLLPFFSEKLEHYDLNREKYKTFKSFFPELLKVFSEVKPIKSYRPKTLGLYFEPKQNGIGIKHVSSKSPYKELIKKDDVIVSLNNQEVNSEADIMFLKDIYYSSSKSKDLLKIKILRNLEEKIIEVKIQFEESYLFEKK